jgi:hypothetical protein
MQNQNQIRQREENIKPISEQIISNQIKRDTSRLNADPSEKLKKLIQKLYMWIWILLGISALLLIFILLKR